MLAQSTLREGLQVAQSWGPVGVSLVGIIIYAIVSNINIHKKAVTPVNDNANKIDRLFEKNDELFKMQARLDKEVEKKVSHLDVENKLVKYQLKEVCDTQFKSVELRLVHMETLLNDIHMKLVSNS